MSTQPVEEELRPEYHRPEVRPKNAGEKGGPGLGLNSKESPIQRSRPAADPQQTRSYRVMRT